MQNDQTATSEAGTKSLKQKIWMMAAIMGPLSIAKGAQGSPEFAEAQKLVDAAQIAFRLGETGKARELADASVAQLLNCVALLPKTPRKLVAANLKRIAKY